MYAYLYTLIENKRNLCLVFSWFIIAINFPRHCLRRWHGVVKYDSLRGQIAFVVMLLNLALLLTP